MTRPRSQSRNVRVPDQLWQAAQAAAARRGETVSEAVRRLLHQYVNDTPRGSTMADPEDFGLCSTDRCRHVGPQGHRCLRPRNHEEADHTDWVASWREDESHG